MMVNFIEKNKRLPKNMQEVMKAPRFHKSCGCRKEVRCYIEDLVQGIFTSVIAINIGEYIAKNSKNEIIITIAIYIVTGFIIGVLMKKYYKLEFIIEPMQNVFSYILQNFRTTRKVKEIDIILAYYAAREWMKIVYPEFYNEEYTF